MENSHQDIVTANDKGLVSAGVHGILISNTIYEHWDMDQFDEIPDESHDCEPNRNGSTQLYVL